MVTEKPLHASAKRCGGEKSKTGCLTCRIRRVKCDETLPCCRRCTSTGRTCEGPASYHVRFVQETIPQKTNLCAVTYIAQPMCPTLFSDNQSRRSLAQFLNRTAPILSGALDVNFWRYYVPQLANSEPIIRNAVLAINDLFERPQTESLLDDPRFQPGDDSYHRRALDSYNAAISCFNRGMQQSSHSVSVALISCILFVCIELQLDGFDNALDLLEKGLALHSSTLGFSLETHTSMSALDEAIIRILWRLAIQVSVFGREMPQNWGVQHLAKRAIQTRLSSFESLEEACFLQYVLRDNSHAFLRKAAEYDWSDPQMMTELTTEQQSLLAQLKEWHSRFETLKRRTREEVRTSAILSMTYESLLIWVTSSPRHQENVFDKFNEEFERILSHAETAIEADDWGATFRFNESLLVNLHTVAVKCRHPIIRRRALSLIQRCPARECWWKASPHARLAKRAILVEEQTSGRLIEFAGPYGRGNNGHTLVEESKRLYHLEFPGDSKPGMISQRSVKAGRYLAAPL